MGLERGSIVAITAHGRMTLDADGRGVLADVMSGGGGWIGDVVEGHFLPGPQSWRNVANGIVSRVWVRVAEVAACPGLSTIEPESSSLAA